MIQLLMVRNIQKVLLKLIHLDIQTCFFPQLEVQILKRCLREVLFFSKKVQPDPWFR